MKNRRYRQTSVESIDSDTQKADKTVGRASVKNVNDTKSKDSDDSLGRASESTVKMTETVKTTIVVVSPDDQSKDKSYPSLTERMNNAGNLKH